MSKIKCERKTALKCSSLFGLKIVLTGPGESRCKTDSNLPALDLLYGSFFLFLAFLAHLFLGDLCFCVCNFLWMQFWTSSSGKGWLFLPPPTQVTVTLRPVRPPQPSRICMENILLLFCLHECSCISLESFFGIVSWI